jgi:hypothetical protein
MKRPIWLGDAAAPEAALPPTIQRIARLSPYSPDDEAI